MMSTASLRKQSGLAKENCKENFVAQRSPGHYIEGALRQILTKFRDSSVKVFERTLSQSGGKHTNSTETATGA